MAAAPDGERFIEGGTLVLACAGLSVYLARTCYLLSSPERRAKARAAAGRLCWRTARFRGRSSELEVKVRDLIARERVRCVRHYAQYFVHFYALVVVAHLVSPGRDAALQGGQATRYVAQRAVDRLDVCWHLFACTVFVAFPRLVTTRSIDLVYVLFSAWWMFRALVAIEVSVEPAVLSHIFLQRAILGLLVCNANVTSACNLAVLLTQCLARASNLVREGMVLRNDAYMDVVMDIVGTAFIVCALMFLEHWVWAASSYVLEIKSSSKTEVTVLRLLSALCDAVVTLSSDLRISARAPKLANLLLLGTSTRSLEGSEFLELMMETDQIRFREFLARAPDWTDFSMDPEPAQALNVHLRDSSGIYVQVQLFHSLVQDHIDQVGHLIGICEVGDTGGARLQGGVGQRLDINNQGAAEATDRVARASNGGGSNDDSVSTTRGIFDLDSETSLSGYSASVIVARSHSQELGGHRASPAAARVACAGDHVAPLRSQAEERVSRGRLQQREISLHFDTLRFTIRQHQSNVPVVDASLLERESLQTWITEWASCRAWMQDFVNAALRPVTATTWPSSAGQPSTLTFHVAFQGSTSLPPDILTRPNISSANSEGPERRRGASSATEAIGRGPPMRLGISRIRLGRRRLRSPAPSHSSSSLLPSEPGLRGVRPAHHHAQVAATLLGAPGTSVPERLRTTEEAVARQERVRL